LITGPLRVLTTPSAAFVLSGTPRSTLSRRLRSTRTGEPPVGRLAEDVEVNIPATSEDERPGRDWVPLSVRMSIVSAMGAAAAAGCLVAVLSQPWPAWWVLPLLGAVLIPALLLELPLRLGNRRVQVAGLIEGALVICLTLPAGSWTPLVVGAVVAVGQIRRRQPPSRALLNTAIMVVPCTLAMSVLNALTPATRGWGYYLAVVAAAVTFTVANELLLNWVVAAATGSRLLPSIRADLATTAVGLLVNLALGLAVLAAVASGQWAVLLAAPLCAAVVMRRYRRRLLSDTTSDALPRLMQAAQRLETIDESQAILEVLDRAAALFAVDRAELVLLGWPGVGDQVHSRTAENHLRSVRGRPPAADDPHVLTAALLTGAAGVTEVLGELRLTFSRPPALTVAEQQVLATFTAAIAASLAQARSYAEQVHTARRDPLTGLANRLALRERVEQLLPVVLDEHAAAAEQGTAAPGLAVLLFDLDHFKEVNDTLGHTAGDALLVELAARLTASLRPGDLAARLGGDEFAVVLQDMPSGRLALSVAEKLLARLNEPVHVEGLELPVEASVGVALAPRDGTTVDGLLRCADVAMYRAKAKRNAAVVYDPSLDPAGEERLQLVSQLQAAIRAEQIVVHYQPVVCLRTAAVLGAEALVRWQHPERGLLSPGAFVPAVERTALIVPLTLAVLDQAVREAVRWPSPGGRELTLSVNLSPRCLLARNIPDQVVRILAAHGLPARRLILEITETLAMSDLDVVDDVLTRLREVGVRLSVDDFGTGYSSMSFLRRIAVNEVKVDRTFVAAAPDSSGDRAIVRATVELAHGLGLPVVGEGVETHAQLRTLQDSGCDAAQGFLLARPMPAADLHTVLAELNPAVLLALSSPPVVPAQRRAGSTA
jgi:diguanylate cyclase (GGDEF)-like protein